MHPNFNYTLMKNIYVLMLLVGSICSSIAQSKVGTVNSDYIISVMPEFKTVQTNVTTYGTDLEKQLNDKMTIYQDRLKDFKENGKSFDAATLEYKKKQVFDIENEIAKFRENGSKLIQIKRDELMRPLYTKLGETLEKIAKEQGYSQIININAGILYGDPNFDITTSVLKALNIAVPKN